ncbi:MAG TPA: hypothetical protein VHO24_02220 [Opitutaceae bacterium]|nr:hypothetical protein [Opitutaceae bacterium]
MAGGTATLILLLTALVASPPLHKHVHGETAVADDSCAVVLFGQGVSLAVDSAAVPAPITVWAEEVAAPIVEVFVVTPRYLRQPERGPPLG